jgi:hypothetical protein
MKKKSPKSSLMLRIEIGIIIALSILALIGPWLMQIIQWGAWLIG